MKNLGVIVNPVAGIGGRAGLKGSDGLDIQEQARSLGATSESPQRAVQALRALSAVGREMRVFTYPHEMGEDECREAGIEACVVGSIQRGDTTGEDTRLAAKNLMDEGVDLILFSGGDGTARDIYQAIDTKLPVLGIPAGVKIHSAVYAVTPKRAGEIARDFLKGELKKTRLAEVMDIDEEAFRNGQVRARLFGYLYVPDDRRYIQSAKAGYRSEKDALFGISREVIRLMKEESHALFILGPGTTTAFIMEMLGLDYTLLGVDVVQEGSLLAKDANEWQLVNLLATRDARIIVTAIGGQGHIFGRGNQQISPQVIRKVGKEGITVIATQDKLAALGGRPMLVDTGDETLNSQLGGYVRVLTGFGEYTMYKVE